MKKTIILIFLVVIFLFSIIPSLSIKSDSRVEVSDLFVEIPKDSWSRAPVKTVYLPVVFGNLNPNKEVSIKSVEILNKDKQSLVEEKVDIRLKTVYNVHNSTSSAWGKNMNYIYTGSSTPPGTNRYAVYNALKEGRVSASLDGSIAVFSLNGYAPGSVVNVNPGANNISITVSGKCVSVNYPYIFINVYSNNGVEVLSDSFYDYDTDFTKTYYFTATSDCYYRVVVTFKNQYGETGGCCLVNPVYVNLP